MRSDRLDRTGGKDRVGGQHEVRRFLPGSPDSVCRTVRLRLVDVAQGDAETVPVTEQPLYLLAEMPSHDRDARTA
jgi:hypothetical protein